MPTLLGLSAVQWLFLLVGLTTVLLMVETTLGHYRSGFPLRAQFAPLVSEAFLIAACVASLVVPTARGTRLALLVAGTIAITAGLVGVGYHHWFGIVKKAGSYRWLLHYLMYSAPPLVPLTLTLLGAFALAGVLGSVGSVGLARMLLVLAAIGIAGATVQAAIFHYRGAFNTRWMYAPFILPPLAVFALAGAALHPELFRPAFVAALLVLTAFTGAVGVGMHLRGLDRQMGGLYVFLFNVLQGPPPFAPAIMSGFALMGLVGLWIAS
jgi:hypothetical protein